MTPIAHIRTQIFKLSQEPFAKVAGASQATVSRWESGELKPNRENLERIRGAARNRGIPWDDKWFFEVPAEQSQ